MRKLFALAAGLTLVSTPMAAEHYTRQPGVDVQHYAWKVTLSDATDEIFGDAMITVKFTRDGINSVFFDLASKPENSRRGMVVTAVTNPDSTALRYTHAGNRVTITLGSATRAGEVRRFRIAYHGFTRDTGAAAGRGGRGGGGGGRAGAAADSAGRGGRAAGGGRGAAVGDTAGRGGRAGAPAGRGGGGGRGAAGPAVSGACPAAPPAGAVVGGGGSALWIGTNCFGDRAFFSRNWPEGARNWLPCVDHPSDKATSEFIVIAPAKYSVVANGLLQEETMLGNGQKLTRWKQSVPISTWLNNIGVAQFGVRYHGLVKGVQLSTWSMHQGIDKAVGSFEVPARQAIEFFSEHVGPYSYEKMASVAASGGGGGMEHASIIFYGDNPNGLPSSGLVAHETAHQWFGDAVTEEEWDDVWLSEGFATYFAHLFTEHFSGKEAFLNGVRNTRRSALMQEKSQKKPLVHENPNGTGPDLTQLIYQKGGMVLQVLRGQVGTDNFWKGIQIYYAAHQNATATTDDLRRAMEEASGQDLRWFFAQWTGRVDSPVVDGGWTYDATAKKIVVDLAQTQTGEPYRMPLEIGVVSDSAGAQMRLEKIEMTQMRQRFEIAADRAPKDVILDPNVWMLMDAKFVKR